MLDLKVQSGSLANRCQLNVMIVHVCMEVNAKRAGTDTFVNVNIQAFPEQLVEMVLLIFLIKLLFISNIFCKEIKNESSSLEYSLFLNHSRGNAKISRKQFDELKIRSKC